MADKEAPKATQTSASEDAGQAQVQEKMDEITDKGFRGVAVDPTPNDAYTVSGVTSGAPTPETNAEAAKAAAAVQTEEANKDKP